MKTFDAWGVAMLLHHINENREVMRTGCQFNRDEQVPAETIRLCVTPTIMHAKIHAQEFHLTSTLDRVWDGGPFCMASKVGLTFQQAEHEFTVLRQCIEADLEKRLFAFIDPKKVDLFQDMKSTWAPVLVSIQESQYDVEDAHIAYMAELYTATVFHLMRVAEHGLRVLAKRLRVSLDLKDKKGIVPIEYADWQKVITAIKNKLAKIGTTPTGPKRQAKLEKYSDAADHCIFMKDIWRNTVSHARKPYRATEALGVLERVRDFMQFIAKEFAVPVKTP